MGRLYRIQRHSQTILAGMAYSGVHPQLKLCRVHKQYNWLNEQEKRYLLDKDCNLKRKDCR